MHKAKHSKFKNTGILFELLTRQITADIIGGKDESAAKQILFKYFSENTELGKEYQLYNFLLNEKARDASHAERIISVVLESRSQLDDKRLAQQKYELIREIKEIYPIEGFLKANIKNYRIFASIYKIFENKTASKFDVQEVVQSRESIIESLCNSVTKKSDNDEGLLEYYKQQSEDIRLLAYKLLLEGMNTKYKDFDDNQKNLIREYILNVSNTNSLSNYVCEEIEKIKKIISSSKNKVKDNQVVSIKLSEISNVLDKVKPTTVVKDNHIMALLLSYELVKELNNLK
jgi:hypothetical protein